ncbi:heavy-metal-associated domain-containing protein [Peribacillus sp. NPDC006672]|uniref:heavy-metal-associated domain-containing protein n=1 Tax=Peribacillus sp. NPDC006672 TaxID=3390606 RepID=UPI003D01CBFB
MQTTTLYVKEATSEGPILNLESILLKTEGVDRAIIDVDDGEIKIDHSEDQLSPDQLITLIEQYGLNVTK